VRCTVAIGGVDVDLYSVHLHTPAARALDATRRELLHGDDAASRTLRAQHRAAPGPGRDLAAPCVPRPGR
jgi:hypothetical protein